MGLSPKLDHYKQVVINKLLLPLKSFENLWFSDDFREIKVNFN